MLARGHVVSAAASWLAGCALTDLAAPVPTGIVAAGTVVTAGFSLVPDIDHPGSTAARTLGPLSRGLAQLVEAGSGAARKRSCRCCAVDTTGGHRTLTHTGIGAVVTGAVVALAAVLTGPVVAVAVVGFGAWLASHTALSSRFRAELGDAFLPGKFRHRGRGAHRFTASVGSVAIAALFAVAALVGGTALAGWWIGLAVGWGLLAHILGDALTHWGVPLFWPLRVRGCRWRCVGTPRWMRFRAGSPVEVWLVTPLFVLAGAGALWALAV